MTTSLAVVQDLTLFDPTDDDSPLAGTYTAGVVVDPSLSTARTHDRPYLKFVENAGGSTVDFAAGSGVIAQVAIDVVDKRTDPTDQNTGLFTYLAATADGDTALLGARALLRQREWDGVTMGKIIDGVIYSVKLLTSGQGQFTTYRIIVRDVRERERKVRLFVNASSTAVFPFVGPANGYGYNTQWNDSDQNYENVGDPVLTDVPGLQARVQVNTYSAASDWLSFIFTDPARSGVGYLSIPPKDYALWEGRVKNLKDVWDLIGKIQPLDAANTTASPDAKYYAPGAIVEWSATGAHGPWTTISQPFVPVGLRGYTSILQLFPEDWKQGNPQIPHQIVIMRPTDTSLRPTNGTLVWVRIRSLRAPTADVPLWLEQSFGGFLKSVYDGNHSYAGLGMNMRYDATAMTNFDRAAGKMLAKITEPVDDAAAWLQENVYRATGFAPAIRDGVVYPVSADLPDSSLSIPTLDDSVVYPGEAEWVHGSELVINHGEYIYERDLIPSTYSSTGTIVTQQVSIQRDNGTSQARHGSKPVVFQPVTVRAIYGFDVSQGVPNPDVSHEDASRRAFQRITATIRRFANGAQQAVATCRASLTDTINVGDWVLLGVSWMPDYLTRVRGINRLMQVVSVEKPEPHKRRFTLVDAGPYDQPIARPTSCSIAENSDASLVISVGGVPTTGGPNPRAEVQISYGEAQPATDSGEWKTVGLLTASGDVLVATHPSGLNAWARARGVADGARSSVWRNSAALRTSTVPGLRQARLEVNPYDAGTNPGYARAVWQYLTGVAGIRVHFDKFAIGGTEPDSLTSFHDQDATLGLDDFTHLEQWEQVVVQLEPCSGYSAGVCFGGGQMTSRMKIQRRDRPYVAPAIAVDVTRSGGNGTVTITPVDPQGQITAYWFRHRSGNSGSWSSFAQDSSAPYADTVAIPAGQGSAIEYKVYAYAEDGTVYVLDQQVIELARVNNGPSITSSAVITDTQATIYYSGTGTITLSIDNGGFFTPAPTGFVVMRDAGAHTYVFKAEQDDQFVSSGVTIPGRGEVLGVAEPSIDSLTFTASPGAPDRPCDGGGGGVINFTSSNMPGSETYNVKIYVDGGTRGANGPYSYVGVTDADRLGDGGTTPAIDLCDDSYGRVEIVALAGSEILATANTTF